MCFPAAQAPQPGQGWGRGMPWGGDSPVWQGGPEGWGGGSRCHWPPVAASPPCLLPPAPRRLPQEHEAKVKALMKGTAAAGALTHQTRCGSTAHKTRDTSPPAGQHRTHGAGPPATAGWLAVCPPIHHHPEQARAEALALPSYKLPAGSVKGNALVRSSLAGDTRSGSPQAVLEGRRGLWMPLSISGTHP